MKRLKDKKCFWLIADIVAVLSGLGLVMWGYINIDKIPATPDDYQVLERQIVNIQQDPDMLFEMEDCRVSISGEEIKVDIENEECEISVLFNKNFEVISTTKKDKCISEGALIIVLAVIFFVGVELTAIAFSLLAMGFYVCKKVIGFIKRFL